jgi:hypothetical protein
MVAEKVCLTILGDKESQLAERISEKVCNTVLECVNKVSVQNTSLHTCNNAWPTITAAGNTATKDTSTAVSYMHLNQLSQQNQCNQ